MKTLDELLFEFRRLDNVTEMIDYYSWFINDKEQQRMLMEEWNFFNNIALISILRKLRTREN
jgi:hypothetical protein